MELTSAPDILESEQSAKMAGIITPYFNAALGEYPAIITDTKVIDYNTRAINIPDYNTVCYGFCTKKRQMGKAIEPGNAAMHNGTINTLSNGHIITENGKVSEAYTRQAGQGYITGTSKPQSIATKRTTIPAIVDRDHTLYSGSLLQIRLLKDVNLSGITVPLNYYVYGIVKFAKERIYIDFKTIELNNSIVDFKAVVYDYDGLLGLDAPGTMATDIAKNAGVQAIDGTNATVSGDTESLLGNATAAVTKSAVNAVKSLSSEQKVNIKAGHKLFLVF